MSTPPIQLSPEQRQAILACPGEPIHIEDQQTQKVYLLLEEGAFPKLEQDYIRQGLELARQQILRGQTSTASVDEIISEGQRRGNLGL
jgi:hypothetical protein